MINDINTNFIEVRVTIYKKQLYSVRYRADEFEIQIQVQKIVIDLSQSNVFFCSRSVGTSCSFKFVSFEDFRMPMLKVLTL